MECKLDDLLRLFMHISVTNNDKYLIVYNKNDFIYVIYLFHRVSGLSFGLENMNAKFKE